MDEEPVPRQLRQEKVIWTWLSGRWFGYPTCCIEYFLRARADRRRGDPDDFSEEDHRLCGSYGFIPCPNCRQMVRSGEATIENLIAQRLCPTPWPQGVRLTREGAYLALQALLLEQRETW